MTQRYSNHHISLIRAPNLEIEKAKDSSLYKLSNLYLNMIFGFQTNEL